MAVQPGLYPTWSETLKNSFLTTRLIWPLYDLVGNPNDKFSCDESLFSGTYLEEQSGQGLSFHLLFWRFMYFTILSPVCLSFRAITAIYSVSVNSGLKWYLYITNVI